MRTEALWDVIVIGGGPAGLMAAIAAQSIGARTLLIEKGHKLGRKLAISGGGRCNVTNAKPLEELMKNIPGNGRFLHSAFSQFSNQDIANFFEQLGIALKEEDHGRVFPVSDKAATVVQTLVNQLDRSIVTVWLDTAVRDLIRDENGIRGLVTTTGQTILAPSIVVATGGCSVPQTGSTGDAYPWARELGHTIVPPYPTEVPLTSNAPFIVHRTLQGLSFREVTVQIFDAQGKRLTQESGDLLFAHFGLTGPVALRCSHYVSTVHRTRPQEVLTAVIDFLPQQSIPQLMKAWETARQTSARKQVATILQQWVPERLADFILQRSAERPIIDMAHLSKETEQAIVHMLKNFSVPITGTLPLEKATVTGGGVSIKEIVPQTMASKRCPGLFFAGEVLDVHAHTGGYNISVAFSTGHAAGIAAARFAHSLPHLL
ncbi:MAG: NAD(P)/FAD-dependent oxidoreductase [Firmicutes bacterium]|nr:NAD(P)/FAD-dependent oxidoreductase [Bacillota bacterium]